MQVLFTLRSEQTRLTMLCNCTRSLNMNAKPIHPARHTPGCWLKCAKLDWTHSHTISHSTIHSAAEKCLPAAMSTASYVHRALAQRNRSSSRLLIVRQTHCIQLYRTVFRFCWLSPITREVYAFLCKFIRDFNNNNNAFVLQSKNIGPRI